MQKCPKCEMEVGDDKAYCPGCGLPLNLENIKNDGSAKESPIGPASEDISNPPVPSDSPKIPQTGAIATSLKKASPIKRLIALILDTIVASLIMFAGSIPLLILSIASDSGLVLMIGYAIFLIALVIAMLYSILKDGLFDGRSVGKKVMGLRVVDFESKKSCTKMKSAIRNIIYMALSATVLGFLIECAMVMFTKDGRRLGDLGAKTQVIPADS